MFIPSDHFNKATIKKINQEHPAIRFGCCQWLVQELINLGIDKRKIDVYEIGMKYDYNLFKLVPIKLFHDVPQCGYRLFIDDYKVFYATDTKTLDGIIALEYDYYFVEANYIDDEELHDRAYNDIYESRVKNTHLSKVYATNWLLENMGANSVYEFMHMHRKKGEK